jgi:hypothetical protein
VRHVLGGLPSQRHPGETRRNDHGHALRRGFWCSPTTPRHVASCDVLWRGNPADSGKSVAIVL